MVPNWHRNSTSNTLQKRALQFQILFYLSGALIILVVYKKSNVLIKGWSLLSYLNQFLLKKMFCEEEGD